LKEQGESSLIEQGYAHVWYGKLLMDRGRYLEAAEIFRKGLDLENRGNAPIHEINYAQRCIEEATNKALDTPS
jgi:tetratricopeptide (TPR) repeat protein